MLAGSDFFQVGRKVCDRMSRSYMIAAFGREYFGQHEEKMAEVVERLYWCNVQKMRVFIVSINIAIDCDGMCKKQIPHS